MGDTKIRVKGWLAVIPWMTDKVRQARNALKRLYHDRDPAYYGGLFVEPPVFSARPVEDAVEHLDLAPRAELSFCVLQAQLIRSIVQVTRGISGSSRPSSTPII